MTKAQQKWEPAPAVRDDYYTEAYTKDSVREKRMIELAKKRKKFSRDEDDMDYDS